MSLTVLYFLHNTSVLSFYIDVILTHSNRHDKSENILFILWMAIVDKDPASTLA